MKKSACGELELKFDI